VQKYFKQLRKRGFPCRYLMTGEHGSKKGRAHWHGIVFWQERVPQTMTDYGRNSWHRAERGVPIEVPIVWGERFNEPCWVHGFSHWEPVRNGHEKGSIAYACKYINKDVDDPHAQSKLAMSKLPPIGTEYFVKRAHKFVEERIAPQDGRYQFPLDARRKSDGKPMTFMLGGKVEEIFCEEFVNRWRGLPCRGVYGPTVPISKHLPESEYIDEYLDADLRERSGDYEYVGSDRYIRMPAKTLKGEKAWQDVEIPNSEAAIERLRVENRYAPQPKLTQLAWVEKLSDRCVFWITSSVTKRGRYRRVMQPSGQRVWMLSLME
jgi:hypothetical protein